MEKKKPIVPLYSVCLIFLALVALPLLAFCAERTSSPTPSPTAVIELKASTAWPRIWESNRPFFKFIDLVNEKGKGIIRIKLIGGPEAVPSLQGLDYLRKGVIDITVTSCGYFTGVVPEGQATGIWYGPAHIEREAGLYDLLDKIFRKRAGVVFLGRGQIGASQCVFTRTKINKIDLTGLKLRSIKAYEPVIKALGGTPVMIPPEEVYNALQTGVVDGQGWSGHMGFKDARLNEVLHHRATPYFGQTDTAILVNASVFDKLPPAAKEVLMKAQKDMEEWSWNWTRNLYIEREKELVQEKKTLTVTPYTPEEAAKFRELAWKVKMEDMVQTCPEYGSRLKKILEGIKNKQAEPPVP
jgi:TRAP-type C4-dicarboxylate transport system substrate-binding protein